MEDEFSAAIGTDQLTMHYQPIINLLTGRVDGLEALMRWTHPVKGPIPPGVFIPLAEESGLIIKASRWALREACRALNRIERRASIDRDLFMSVNFSPADFAEENFLGQIYDIVSETDIMPQKLHLEITEQLLTQHADTAKDILALCRKAGLNISIDHFGLQSLPHLERFPVNVIKIDGSVIGPITEDERLQNFLRIILHDYPQIQIIAEYVETAEQAEMLSRLGCVHAQGYYFARPESEANVIDALQNDH